MANITSGIRRILSEISYADRRAFEIRTGIAPTRKPEIDRARQIAELDATWALSHRNY